MEKLFSDDPDYFSTIVHPNQMAPFDGLISGCRGRSPGPWLRDVRAGQLSVTQTAPEGLNYTLKSYECAWDSKVWVGFSKE